MAPTFALIAGVNGAGRSTFYYSGEWKSRCPDVQMWINPDNILQDMKGDWRSEADQLAAGRRALRQMDGLMEERRSFCQETTLSGKSCLKRIERARALGYRVVMFYLGVSSPDIANERVAQREQRGGHVIPKAAVERRYVSSLSNFDSAIPLCSEIYAFDNTDVLKCWATWQNGFLTHWRAYPLDKNWLYRAISEELVGF